MDYKKIEQTPCSLLPSERIMLYSLVYGIRPDKVLEIGTLHGGSAQIMVMAMDDIAPNFVGRIACVDPNPQITVDWGSLSHRAELIQDYSPQALSKASESVGGKFKFAFIDGDHTYDGVIRDFEGVLEFMDDDSYMLFHDSWFVDVEKGIDKVLTENPGLSDAGLVSRDKSGYNEAGEGPWGGMRLVYKK